jgi:acyl carrier protein
MSQVQMTPEQIREEIRKRVAELTERDPSEISDTARFVEDLDIDSLMAIELMVTLDKEYKIDIAEEEFRNIKNVSEAVDIVLAYLEKETV